MQREIKTRHNLLDANGLLTEQGYATSLILNYDRKQIKKPNFRIKEWDYYIVTDGKKAVAFTISDCGYMGLNSLSFLNFETGEQTTKTKLTAFPMGKLKLPSSSEHGISEVSGKDYSLRFEKSETARRITCRWDNFYLGKALTADIVLTEFPKHSMVIATDFINSSNAFYYNQKVNAQRASGTVTIGGNEYQFNASDSLGTLDWGRGVWSYQNTWYWGSLSARLNDGRTVGFNIGTGFANNTYATEDMFFLDGESTKLDNVRWHIPKREDGSERFMDEWEFRSDCGKLNLTFRPVLDRVAIMNVVVLKTEQHQVFGKFYGTVVADNGETVMIDGLLGFAEKVFNRY